MKILFSALLIIGVAFAQAQTQDRFGDDGNQAQTQASSDVKPISVPLRERFSKREYYRFGGNLSAVFGTYTAVNVSPRVYFLPTDKLWTGLGFNFIYSNDKRYLPPFNESFTYGPSILAMYQLFAVGTNALFVQGEYEALNFEVVNQTPQNEFYKSRLWANNVLLGGTLNLGSGGVAAFLSVLYNVNYRDQFTNYHTSPWVIRIGFGF